jgi:hypothetical protein
MKIKLTDMTKKNKIRGKDEWQRIGTNGSFFDSERKET